MGKTKFLYIAFGVLAAVMTTMLVLVLRMGDDANRMLFGVCWIVLLLVFVGILVGVYRLRRDYSFWSRRYEEELNANVNELMDKTADIASFKAKIDRLTHEVERLNRINFSYQRTATSLRQELGSTRDKFDESCRLLADIRERAEQGDKMKASFLANVTHELRTPLNSVLGYSTIINNPSISEERRQHFMKVLQKSCDRFLDTLNDMLYYSQLQSGDIDVSPTVFEVNAMLCSLRALTESKIAESGKNIELVFENEIAGKGYICGFEAGYYKLLSNLLDNAVKYTNEGRITVSYESNEDKIRFEVSDTGIGIDPSKKEMLFGSFNQSEASLSRQYEGSGLGLSICRSIVSLMNGTLEVESHPGVGSKFSFEVPLLATPRKDVELYVKVENMLSNSNDRGAILVMSPYIEDYDFVNNFFGTYGVEVMRCRSVEEVEILMASHPRFNIAIIDLTASPDDGITAADMVFGVNPKTRFVFVRGKTLDGPVAAKTGLYSDYMIQRPLSSKTLCNLLGGY